MKTKRKSIIAAALCVLLLCGCGVAAGPGSVNEAVEATEAPAPTPETQVNAAVSTKDSTEGFEENTVVEVYNINELLDAIAPNTTIVLKAGLYSLTDAEGYGGQNGNFYRWNQVYDGCELVISYVDNLRIVCEDGSSGIETSPRYANVVSFENCRNLSIENIVFGHSPEDGSCTGGVLYFDSCNDVQLYNLNLFGCGTIGIHAQNCKNLAAYVCDIYDCSTDAVMANSSYNVLLDTCRIFENGNGAYGENIFSVFTANSCNGFAVVNCDIYNNYARCFLNSQYSQQVSIMGSSVKDCAFTDAVFCNLGYSPVISDSSFENIRYERYIYEEWDDSVMPVDEDGNELSKDALMAMAREGVYYEGPKAAEKVELEIAEAQDGRRLVTVSTVDELLAAIASDTVINIGSGFYDLSESSDYGAYGSENYYWVNNYDGPGLIISNVQNLSIIGEDATISAIPRYADVLTFTNCEDIELKGFTMGHTEEPGSCSGGVLNLQSCKGVTLDDCGLYGCGIIGITAQRVYDLYVKDCEIYDCSQGALNLMEVRGGVFENCDIHDCHSPEISLSDCSNISYNGKVLNYGMFVMNNGVPEEFKW